ncbi:F-box protein interaction domain protein [Medicago truncatula]|uniref:F-box protein interaction domain protein n=3 Tax=Medicago truncatula TaxID=3880 RepID=A0A072UK66_MEDTR|nr:F-box protein interaction domain protein [Medicago truncatula]
MKQTLATFIRILKSLFFTFIITLKSLFVSSEPPPSLPMDLVEEILCRLPVKLLFQLRCQSKSFNTLISSLEFARKHLSMSNMHHHHLIITYSHESYSKSRVFSYPLHSIFYPRYSIFNSIVKPTELEYPFDKEKIVYGGSCHGILCLARKQDSRAKVKDVILWNPAIKKFQLSPSFKYPPIRDNYEYNPIFGFGYDHIFNLYKVVVIFDSVDGISKAVMVHTLGTSSWRLINVEFPLPNAHYRSLQFASGALHWIPYRKDYTHSVDSFDLVTESYKRLLQPNYGVEDVYKVILGVSRNCLCIFACKKTFFDAWLMKEYGNEGSWTKLFRVPYMEVDPFTNAKTTYPLWISEEDQVLMEYTYGGCLAVCDFKNGTFKFPKIQNIDGPNAIFNLGKDDNAEVYVESLISPCF